jgi:transposase
MSGIVSHRGRPRGGQSVPDHYRAAHALKADGWTTKEIAEHFGTSTKIVAQWFQRVEEAIADARNIAKLRTGT